ncbi:MAG: TraR/DksA family transcriptional regulator [Acidobacteria bacterium]|nr:TraR/DksA family transcriptional regulator [Acidobacteriota bacterium]
MTKTQANRFKSVLEARRQDLIREMDERRESLAVDRASDPLDLVVNIADRDFAGRDMNRIHGMLRLVENALREIREGTFGVCARCGANIPVKRLEAVPWSPYCVSCQERMEQSPHEAPEFESPYELAS